MVPAPQDLIEVSLKVLSSKPVIDPHKGALDLRIDGFHRIDVRLETGAGILSGTMIDHLMGGKCCPDFTISPFCRQSSERQGEASSSGMEHIATCPCWRYRV